MSKIRVRKIRGSFCLSGTTSQSKWEPYLILIPYKLAAYANYPLLQAGRWCDLLSLTSWQVVWLTFSDKVAGYVTYFLLYTKGTKKQWKWRTRYKMIYAFIEHQIRLSSWSVFLSGWRVLIDGISIRGEVEWLTYSYKLAGGVTYFL